MQVMFTRWTTGPEGRTPIAVNPKRVDCVEFVSHPQPVRAAIWTGEAGLGFDATIQAPACTNIIMQGKQSYWVQGTVEEVTAALNGGEI
jgi:hypothetical protein